MLKLQEVVGVAPQAGHGRGEPAQGRVQLREDLGIVHPVVPTPQRPGS